MMMLISVMISFVVVFLVAFGMGKDSVFNKESGFYIVDRRNPEQPAASMETTKPIEEIEKEKFIVLRVVEKPKI